VIELDRPRTPGELMRDMIAVFATSWATYLVIGFVAIVPIYVAVFGIGLNELSGAYDSSPSQERGVLEAGVLLAFSLPLTMTMVARRLVADDSTGRAIQGGFERFALALIVAVVAIAATVAGLFAFIVPGVYLAIRLSLAVPAAALEELGPIDALRRSWALTATPHTWRALRLMALVLVFMIVVEAVIELPFFLIAESADKQGIGLAGSMLSYVVTLPIATIGAALVLFDLRARQSA
jgi:hypothetical protein